MYYRLFSVDLYACVSEPKIGRRMISGCRSTSEANASPHKCYAKIGHAGELRFAISLSVDHQSPFAKRRTMSKRLTALELNFLMTTQTSPLPAHPIGNNLLPAGPSELSNVYRMVGSTEKGGPYTK